MGQEHKSTQVSAQESELELSPLTGLQSAKRSELVLVSELVLEQELEPEPR
jgi:hypothetical protein